MERLPLLGEQGKADVPESMQAVFQRATRRMGKKPPLNFQKDICFKQTCSALSLSVKSAGALCLSAPGDGKSPQATRKKTSQRHPRNALGPSCDTLPNS